MQTDTGEGYGPLHEVIPEGSLAKSLETSGSLVDNPDETGGTCFLVDSKAFPLGNSYHYIKHIWCRLLDYVFNEYSNITYSIFIIIVFNVSKN